MNWYALLKLIHVLSAVIWVGGITATAAITGRMLQAGDHVTLAKYFQHALPFAQRMIGPAAILVLLTGIPMVILGKIGFGAFWVSYGFFGILVHFVLGGTLIRKRSMALAQLLSASPQDDRVIAEAGARLRQANLIYLLVMVSVIGAMVLKPTL